MPIFEYKCGGCGAIQKTPSTRRKDAMYNRRTEHGALRAVSLLALSLIMTSEATWAEQAGKSPVKVFILAGQSNMQGKGSIEHLQELVAENPTEYGHLKKNGRWVKRDDVWIKYGDKKGRLTVGYGSPENTYRAGALDSAT